MNRIWKGWAAAVALLLALAFVPMAQAGGGYGISYSVGNPYDGYLTIGADRYGYGYGYDRGYRYPRYDRYAYRPRYYDYGYYAPRYYDYGYRYDYRPYRYDRYNRWDRHRYREHRHYRGHRRWW